MGQREGACSRCAPLCPPAPCLPLPWHSQAVGEVLHEWAQAGEGEDGQDGKGQLEGEEDEGGMAARLGCWGRAGEAPPPYQDALQDVEQVIHAREVADILEGGHKDGGQDGEGAGEDHPGEAGPAELQEALGTRQNLCPRHAWGIVPGWLPPNPGSEEHGGGIAPLSCAKVLSGPLQGCCAPLDVSSSSLSK